MILERFEKQPVDVKDFLIKYVKWLEPGDVISDVVCTIECVSTPSDTALQQDRPVQNTTNTVRVWLKGGTAGETYKVSITITTSPGGRVDQIEFIVKVKEY